ncbi:MAG: helix-turn-helix domain-containing protein [Komarekiella atlantica HA4396-MV6]|nr:helix-turn-helix domain-containing protein [Komarekiella atlantica HA4396-MV6]
MLTAKQPEIGKLIRELRQEMGLTQEKFAAKLGVTFPTINRWENGRSQPSPLAMEKVVSLLTQMSNSPKEALRARDQDLLSKYFPE